jgi:hypothetical protein
VTVVLWPARPGACQRFLGSEDLSRGAHMTTHDEYLRNDEESGV